MGFITIPHTFSVDTTVRSFWQDSAGTGTITANEGVFVGTVINIDTDTITLQTPARQARLPFRDGDTVFSTNQTLSTTIDGDATYDEDNQAWVFDVDAGGSLNDDQGLWLQTGSDQTIATNASNGINILGTVRFDKGTRITSSNVDGMFV